MEKDIDDSSLEELESFEESFEEALEAAEQHGLFAAFKRGLSDWSPQSSDELLRASEQRLLKTLKTPFVQKYVPIGGGNVINTIVLGQGPPLVLIHGFGGGVGTWVANLDEFSSSFTVHACDLLGWGRSSRPPFTGKSADEGEQFFVESIKAWVDALGLQRFRLAGHSMGAFLSALFTLKYPQYVERLVLADPWGVPTSRLLHNCKHSWSAKAVASLSKMVASPFTILRAAGPVGLSLISKMRSDLGSKFRDHFDPQIFMSYVYHCNVQTASGEDAFTAFNLPVAWAHSPLADRLDQLPTTLPVFAIYGKDTWMNLGAMRELIKGKLHAHTVEMIVLPDAGHHVYIDNAADFNEAVKQALLKGTMSKLSADLIEFQNTTGPLRIAGR